MPTVPAWRSHGHLRDVADMLSSRDVVLDAAFDETVFASSDACS
jgi:hypothetical protein